MDSAVAVVGCNSRSLGRSSCEYDVIVVTGDKRPPMSLRIGEIFVDLAFVSEKEVLNSSNPEHAMSVALARPVRDTSLVLSTGCATNSAVFMELAKQASGTRLSSALKTLGRAEAALSRGMLIDADFWLLASSYEYAYARLLSRETLPSPSHLLSQLRELGKGAPRSFEGVSLGAGLEAAGRAGCGARLEGVTVLHDLLREGSKVESSNSSWPQVKTEILVAKAQELIARAELAECYSYLGQELVDDMMNVLRLHPKRTLTSLTTGRDRLLGERLMRQLGLARGEKAVQAGVEVVKQQVSLLARRT